MTDAIHPLLVASLRGAQVMLNRHLEGLNEAQYLHRAVPNSNCAAWLVGHLTLSERWAIKTVNPDAGMPELPDGFEARFGRDASVAGAADFGDVKILAPLFNQHRDALIATVEATPVDKLQEKLEKPHPRFTTRSEMMGLVCIHGALHAGQISTIRRSLGMPPL